MQKRLWLRYRPRARTRLPLKRMATLMPECLRQLVCRNYRTVWDRLCPVAHWRLIKEAPRSFAWPRRGSKWTKLSDKHFKEWPKERDELFNCTKKRASGCETKPRMPRGVQHNLIQTTYQQQHRNNFDTEPKSLVYAPSSLSKDLYPNVNTSVLTILHIMLVSTPTPVRSFSTTRRVKTYLRSIMSTACLSPTVLIHPYRVFPNDTQREVVTWDPC